MAITARSARLGAPPISLRDTGYSNESDHSRFEPVLRGAQGASCKIVTIPAKWIEACTVHLSTPVTNLRTTELDILPLVNHEQRVPNIDRRGQKPITSIDASGDISVHPSLTRRRHPGFCRCEHLRIAAAEFCRHEPHSWLAASTFPSSECVAFPACSI